MSPLKKKTDKYKELSINPNAAFLINTSSENMKDILQFKIEGKVKVIIDDNKITKVLVIIIIIIISKYPGLKDISKNQNIAILELSQKKKYIS